MSERLTNKNINHCNQGRRFKTEQDKIEQFSINQQIDQQTDEQQYPEHFAKNMNSNLPKGFCQYQQYNSISQVFKYIQNSVNYQQMTVEEIIQQKETLKDHIYFLNLELDQLVKKRLNKVESRVSQKTKKSYKNKSNIKYNEWDDTNMERQIINNHKLMLLLHDEYQCLKKKLQKTQMPSYKIQCQNKIAQVKQQINKMNLFLSERKRKNVMNGKKITQLDKQDTNKLYVDLQQQYVVLSKKREDYIKKIDKMIEDNANIVQQHSKASTQAIQLKKEAFEVLKNIPNQMEEQHNRVMYETKCRKMQLCLRKRQREQQTSKRKYYELLKDYQKVFQNTKALDQKISNLRNQISTSMSKTKNSQNRIQQHENNKKQQKEDEFRVWRVQDEQNIQQEHSEIDQNSGFMLTQLNNQKSTTKVGKKNFLPSYCFSSQSLQRKLRYNSTHISNNQIKLVPISKKISTQPNMEHSTHRNRNIHQRSLNNSQISEITSNFNNYRVDSRETQKKESNLSNIALQNYNLSVQNSNDIEDQQYIEDFEAQSP